jgi:hypothetical protein
LIRADVRAHVEIGGKRITLGGDFLGCRIAAIFGFGHDRRR